MANPIDTAAAKAKGMQRGMEARREGLVGVFLTLAKQHGEAGALLDRVKDDPSKRESLWPKIKIALVSHEKGELKVVFPALARHIELQPYVEQHAREAKQLDDMIARLDSLAIESDEWMSVFVTLAGTVVAHAAEEDTVIFPRSLQFIGADRAKELDDAFKSAQNDVESSLKKAVH
jgi:hypothetical protein